MSNEIWVFLEQEQEKFRKVSLELLSHGRDLAQTLGVELCAVIVGKDTERLVAQVMPYGAAKIYLAKSSMLINYTVEGYTAALYSLLRAEQPDALLIGNTAFGRDLAPRLAQRLGVGLVSDCLEVRADPEKFLLFKRAVYAGKAFAHIESVARPILATVRPNRNPVNQSNSSPPAKVIEIDVEIEPKDLKVIIKEVALAVSKRPKLMEADIVVAGGRGLKGAENFKLLEEMADVLGAAVGASRAAVDSGWWQPQYQIGQTGKTVSPTLYIACGISGAIQHTAGISSSKVIVAINKDPQANIFQIADYGIVGDVLEIIPLLTQELQKLKSEQIV